MSLPLSAMKNGFFVLPNSIFERGLSGKALLVYAFLVRCSNREGECFPSIAKIGSKCGISSRTTVHAALKELIAAKLLTKAARRRESGGKASNTYRIMHPTELPLQANEHDVRSVNVV